MIEKRKVYAYIVQDQDIVLFEQPHSPDAGIQVPGGTVEKDEALDVAVLREAWEETGLDGLKIAHYLGKQERDMRDYGKNEIHHRYFYHLTCATRIPPQWQHTELYSSEPVSGVHHLFAFYRQSLKTIPKLIADFDFYIAQLKHMLV